MHKLADGESRPGACSTMAADAAFHRGARPHRRRRTQLMTGPFVEAKEMIGGYAIFELRDKEEAVAMGRIPCSSQGSHCRAGTPHARCAHLPVLENSAPLAAPAPRDAADAHRTILRSGGSSSRG